MLISKDYLAQQEQLHQEREDYGAGLADWRGFAPALITAVLNAEGIKSLLDYGAGKQALFKMISPDHKMILQAYDPAIKELSEAPEPAEMVACLDVLEHIEPHCLEDVLDDLERVTEKVAFFTVHCGPARKVLPDGRNAHLIQKPPQWWLPKIWERFDVHTFQQTPTGFFCVAYANPRMGGTDGTDHQLHDPSNGGRGLPQPV